MTLPNNWAGNLTGHLLNLLKTPPIAASEISVHVLLTEMQERVETLENEVKKLKETPL